MNLLITTLRKASTGIFMMLAMLVPAAAMAQSQALSGTVTDENDDPIVGAIVSDSSNKLTAMTDINGNYTIANVPAGTEIKVTYLGYKPEKQIWDGKGTLDFRLFPDMQMLEETVVIGYATIKKKDLTGAVATLGSDRLDKQRSPNLSSALQGAIPGLDITRSGSMPGTGASVQIRGVTTISDSSPLIIIDGTPVSDLDNVNPDDVESISVLKDAAAASIYGARAAAGVILITTKKAREGELQISYNGEYSIIEPTSYPEFVTDPIRYMQIINERNWNNAGNPVGAENPIYSQEYMDNYMTNHYYDPISYPVYDWKSHILRSTTPRTKHNVSLSYGGKQVNTRISASYEYTDALYKGSNYERIFVRANNTINFNHLWSANVDFSLRHATKNDPVSGSPIRAANMYPQIYAGTYPDGRIAEGQSGSNTLAAWREGGTQKNNINFLTGKIALNYKPFKFLSFQATMTPTMSFRKIKAMQKAIPYYDAYDTEQLLGYISGYSTNKLTETRADDYSIEKSITATYYQDFGPHSINVLAGYEDYTYHYEILRLSSDNMTLGDYPFMDNANMNELAPEGSAYENAYRSFFGRVMYNYNNRYFFQFNIRGDGSSRFAKQYRWGWFPSASLGWRISNEKFMTGLSPVLSNAMIRASYGSLGNERIGNYPYQASVNLENAIMFGQSGPTAATTAGQINYAVTNITWESTHTWDLGLDFSLFNGRLDFTGDIYYKKTKDMLIATEIPSFSGYGNPQVNAGDMTTRGWELKASWTDNIGRDWYYGIGFNVSNSKSVMGNLNGTVSYSGNSIIREGDEYMAFYGYRSDGLFQSAEDAAGSPKLNAAAGAGDIKYKDLSGADGTPDGIINATYDREVLGSSLPHYIFGGYVNVGWKDLRLSVAFNGVGKQLVRMPTSMVQQSSFLAAPEIIMGKYWSNYNTEEQNLKAKYPRISSAGDSNNYEMSDFWLMDGSYFRVKTINLSYSLPRKWVKKICFDRIRVYFNVEDPFVYSHFPKGWDPEINTSGSNYIARTYTFGLDFSF